MLRSPDENLKWIWGMNAEHYWPGQCRTIRIRGSGCLCCMSPSLRGCSHYLMWCQCLYHLNIDQWQALIVTNWPIRRQIIVCRVAALRDCYCVVSPSLCSIKLMSPLLSNVWPRKKQHKNTSSQQPRKIQRFWQNLVPTSEIVAVGWNYKILSDIKCNGAWSLQSVLPIVSKDWSQTHKYFDNEGSVNLSSL